MGKISKKYIGADQVGSVQIELENGDALRAKNSSGVSVDLMELDPSNLLQLLQHPYLPSDAISNLQAVPKQQLDAAVSTIGSDISALQLEDLTFVKLDGSRSMTGDLSMMPVLGTHYKITGLNDPSDPRDAANKQYVDAVAEGLHIHAPAKVIINETLEAASGGSVIYDNGVSGIGATLVLSAPLASYDLYTFQDGDRVIVNGQANPAHNGIYTVGTNGSLGSVFTRALDFNTPAEIGGGDFVFIQYGTLGANTGWVEPLPVASVGVDPITFIQFSGAGTYVAGDGLVLLGNEFNVKADLTNFTTEINASNQVAVKLDPAGQLSTSASGVAISSTFQGRMSTAESDITSLQTGKANINLDNLAAGNTSIPAGVDLRSLETDQATGFRVFTANQASSASGGVQLRTGTTNGHLSGSAFIIPGLNANANAATYDTVVTGSSISRSGTITGGTKGSTGEVTLLGGSIASATVTGSTGPIYIQSGENEGLGGTGFILCITGDSYNPNPPALGEGSSNSGEFIAGSGKSLAGASGSVFIQSGEVANSGAFSNLASTSATGQVQIVSGYIENPSSASSTGRAYIGSGSHAGIGSSGNVLLVSGTQFGTGASGTVGIASGSITNAASSSTTGQTNISTGNNSGTGNSGNVRIGTGTVASGTRGIIQLDSVRVDLFSEIDMQSHKIVNLTDPSANQDAATKYYVDNALSSSGANRSLSNLIAPTAINEDLIFNKASAIVATKDEDNSAEIFLKSGNGTFSSGDVSINSGDSSGPTGGVNLTSANSLSGSNSGQIFVRTGAVSTGTSGFLRLGSGNVTEDGGNSGWVVITSGGANRVGSMSGQIQVSSGATNDTVSGNVSVNSGDSQSGDTGAILLNTGATSSGAASSGPVSISTGAADAGNSGNITLSTGVSNSGVKGHVEVNAYIDMLSHKIVNVTDPTSAQDAATKAYVDSKIASGTNFLKQIVLLSATDISNGYIDLAAEHLPESTVIGVEQRVNLYETLDYVVSVVSSVTRVTFAGPSAIGGAEALEAGQSLYIQGVQA